MPGPVPIQFRSLNDDEWAAFSGCEDGSLIFCGERVILLASPDLPTHTGMPIQWCACLYGEGALEGGAYAVANTLRAALTLLRAAYPAAERADEDALAELGFLPY